MPEKDRFDRDLFDYCVSVILRCIMENIDAAEDKLIDFNLTSLARAEAA